MKTAEYDSTLQMFKDKPREPKLNYLVFLRKIADEGKFDNKPISSSAGEYAELIERCRKIPNRLVMAGKS